MSEVIVAFWTGTGNTAEMAEYVAEGIREGGAEAKVVSVDDISAADLKDAAAFALGCPSMGVEQLEESTMEPFVEEVCGFASGKTIGLFGSYGWGDGEWMRNWEEDCKWKEPEQQLSVEKIRSARKLQMLMLRTN